MAQGDEIIGNSPQMKKVIELAKTVAQTDTTVMIRGESGSGKRIDRQGDSRQQPAALLSDYRSELRRRAGNPPRKRTLWT